MNPSEKIQAAPSSTSLPAGSDKRKQSLYFSEAMLREITEEAQRLDRSLSWTVQRAWKIARAEMKKIPSVDELPNLPKE